MTQTEQWPASRFLDDSAGGVHQRSVVATERWQPSAVAVYRAPRFAGSRTLVADASAAVRTSAANVVVVLGAAAASVFLIALVIVGVRLCVGLS